MLPAVIFRSGGASKHFYISGSWSDDLYSGDADPVLSAIHGGAKPPSWDFEPSAFCAAHYLIPKALDFRLKTRGQMSTRATRLGGGRESLKIRPFIKYDSFLHFSQKQF